jgi:epidermal growth factor receptor substrate 15
VTSGLPQQTLGEIWALSDPDNNGFLTKEGWYKAARLIGWMQKGNLTTVEESLASKSSLLGHLNTLMQEARR